MSDPKSSPQSPHQANNFFLRSTLMMILLALGLALAFRFGWIEGEPLRLDAQIKHIERQNQFLMVELELVLSNPSSQKAFLPEQSECSTLAWLILDEKGFFVQAKRKNPSCDKKKVKRLLEPWQEVKDHIILRLSAKRYDSNAPYFLTLRYWGLKDSLSFQEDLFSK